MKTAELRAKTPDQLKQELLDLHKEQFNLRFQKSTGQLENASRIRMVRRGIAKVNTLLAEVKQGKEVIATPAKKAAKAKKTSAPKKKKEVKE